MQDAACMTQELRMTNHELRITTQDTRLTHYVVFSSVFNFINSVSSFTADRL